MFFLSSVLRILLFCYLLKTVDAQASPTNPFIWQILTEYNLSESNKTNTYLSETSAKVYSQDFQTVFEYKDRFGYNERLVLDLGDACNETTIANVESYNGNWTTSPSMMSEPSIALVRRGGRCLKWSEKIAKVQELSNTYRLQLSGMVIYDNVSYNDTSYIQEETNDPSYPTWPKSLPNERNISLMTEENIIDKGKTFIAVYFVPLTYMEFLNKTLIQRTFQTNGTIQAYAQLTFSLKEAHFVTSTDPSGSSTTDDNLNAYKNTPWESEEDKRNYIIYSVTAFTIILLVYLMIRWRRKAAQTPAYGNRENGSRPTDTAMTNLRPEDQVVIIPYHKLANISPIVMYDKAVTMKNSACAVCLDDFKSDIYVRVLPCHHGYCTACIDEWLTKKSGLCPICKYDCQAFLNKEVV